MGQKRLMRGAVLACMATLLPVTVDMEALWRGPMIGHDGSLNRAVLGQDRIDGFQGAKHHPMAYP